MTTINQSPSIPPYQGGGLKAPSLIREGGGWVKFRPGEIKVFRKRARLPGHQWAEKNIHVPIGSRQGLYRNQNNPAMHGVLDWATRHHVRTVVMAKGIQIGGTLAFYALLLREAEYSSDSALIVMADERSVKKLSKKRLLPMIFKSPTLSSIQSANPDDTTIYSITLAHGFTIDIGWASSEMSVSSESYRIVILDEISKYKTRGNIEDAKARTTVFPDTKRVWIFSSPGIDTDDPGTRDPLMVEAENCDTMLDYHAICPDCGTEQVMLWDQFKWGGQATLGFDSAQPTISRTLSGVEGDSKSIRRNRSAWYECSHCESRWNDFKRDKAVLSAMSDGWKPTDPEAPERPQAVYFHFPSWLSPFVSLSDVVADWLEAQGDEEKLRKWYNRHAAISYRYGSKTRPHESILKLRDDRPEGLVPSVAVAAITCVADMQKRGFWYKVTAWGFGLDQESWTLKTGFVDSWEALRKIMFESQFADVTGQTYNVSMCAMDSGGGEGEEHADLSRTAEAYLFAAAHPGVILFKGRRRMSRHYNVTDIDRIPGTNKPLPGSAKLYTINTTFFKDKLAAKLLVNPSDPGSWHLHKDIDEDFARQMVAESKNDQGVWDCPKGRDNHYWDCASMEMALVEIAQVKLWPKPDPSQIVAGRRTRSSGIQS